MTSFPRLSLISTAIGLCLLAACTAKAPAGAGDATAPHATASADGGEADAAPAKAAQGGLQSGTSLKIWSGDFEGVQAGNVASGNGDVAQVIERELPAGRGEVSVVRLPAALDLGGVQLIARDGAQVVGQRFDIATATPAGVLERARGERVTVRLADGKELTGTLVGVGDGLTLDVDGGIRVVRDYADLALAKLPRGLSTEPTLRFTVDSPQAGLQRFELRYPSGGLAWRAEYAVTLADTPECKLGIDATALVANRSGASYDAAHVTLIAGDPRRAGPPMVMAQRAMAPEMAASAGDAMGKVANAGMAGEYHSYELPERIDLANGTIERVALLAPVTSAACQRRYTTRAGMGWWSPPMPLAERVLGGDGEQPVVTTLEFDNDKSVGLGVALPGGRVRVSEADGNLVGEVQIGHSPAGKKLELELGTAFDLRAERKQVDFTLDREARVMTEKFEITVHNGGKRASTVRVVEVLPRWSAWEIVESSLPWDKQDAQTILFDVPVGAEAKTVLTYTVRYRWPASVKPQG
jgi:hypothetical protein